MRKEELTTGFLKVKCYHCKGTWRLYGDMAHHKDANRCPFCQAQIRRSIWDKIVLPAYGTLEDANRDLLNEHTGYDNVPLFQIEYQTHRPVTTKKSVFK